MLSRQVAPLLRKFCKVGAYFTIASQRGHALTMLRSFKVILNFSAQYHVAHADSLPSFQHVNNITNFPKALGYASGPTRCIVPAFGHGDQAFALSLFPGSLARTSDGFRLLTGLALRRFFIRLATLHLTKNALALHLLLEDPESLIDIVVANEYPQMFSDRAAAALGGRDV